MTSSKGALRHRLTEEIDQLAQADRVSVTKAIMYAEEAHEGQYRLSTTDQPKPEPYIVHPYRVALIVIEELGLKHAGIICGALLHDVVEMSQGRMTTGIIEREFDRSVALMVSVLTKPPIDDNIARAEQLSTYYGRIARTSAPTKLVKLAEQLDNMREAVNLRDFNTQKDCLIETVEVYVPMAREVDEYLHCELVNACENLERALRIGLASTH